MVMVMLTTDGSMLRYMSPHHCVQDFLQVVSMFSGFQFDWPPLLLDVYKWMSFTNFNLELVAPECNVHVRNFSRSFSGAGGKVAVCRGMASALLSFDEPRLVCVMLDGQVAYSSRWFIIQSLPVVFGCAIVVVLVWTRALQCAQRVLFKVLPFGATSGTVLCSREWCFQAGGGCWTGLFCSLCMLCTHVQI